MALYLRCLIVVTAICLQTASCSSDSGIGIDRGPGWKTTYRDAEPAWSPDGSKIIYCKWLADNDTTPLGTYLYDVASGTSVNLHNPMFIGGPSWSPDGRWIAFHWNYQIFAMKLNGDSLRQLTFNNDHSFRCKWSPCGSLIAYIQTGGVDRGLWLVDFLTGARKLLSLFAEGPPDWFGSCDSLCFVSYKFKSGGGGQIAVIDTVGTPDSSVTRETQITRNTCFKRGLAISPQGDRVVFVQQCGNEPPNLWIINRDGSNVKRLTTKGGKFPDWSPDGQWIIYTNSEEGNGWLWIMRPDGSDRRQLTFPSTTSHN